MPRSSLLAWSLAIGNLVLVAPVMSQTASMSSVEFTNYGATDGFSIGVYGPYQAPVSPSALLFGTLPVGPVFETVVEQHILSPGAVVPLPRYADGSEAAENEVFWTAHVWQAMFARFQLDHYRPASPGNAGDKITITFDGRTYAGGYAIINPISFPLHETNNIDVVVTVVAARHVLPTSAQPASWGDVKSKYRP